MEYRLAAVATLNNADRLVQDAERLVELGSYPTAHALAVLGLEELGKHVHIVSRAVRKALEGDDSGLSQERLRSHHQKLTGGLLLANAVGQEDPGSAAWFEDLTKAVAQASALKLRGIYVDFEGDDVIEPSTAVSQEDAQRMTNLARRTIDVARRAPSAYQQLDDMSADFVAGMRTALAAVQSRPMGENIAAIGAFFRSLEEEPTAGP